ncbi:hypothetical protein QUF72_17695 [Desulfobacterales bacterium HSG2]|nr:hypothetical protein [Desulfobacterales bacterium HSG2]
MMKDPLYPKDLIEKNWDEIAKELFDEDPETYWWKLEKEDEKGFVWKDKRLGINWRASNGYIVALHEVSTPQQATDFAKKNRIRLFEDGGLYYKGVAELYIRCIGTPPREELLNDNDLYRIVTNSGITASIGYCSMLFQRLVASPEAEINPSIPDPKTLTTLVINGVQHEEIPGISELALYHFRKIFKGLRFQFWRLPDYHLAPGIDESPEPEDAPELSNVEDAENPEVISFYNRATESDPISGFLYFYRILEFCFDEVLADKIESWRKDASIGPNELKKKFRNLISDKEDRWALREVLGQFVDQADLDSAHHGGLISDATADALRDCIYARRNSIAHGRLGSNWETLYPFGFSSGDSGAQDRLWYDLMKKLTEKSLQKWIFIH